MSKTVAEEKIGKLGFGLMRLPMNGEEIDIEQTKKMVDEFMAAGLNYFDTAYVYIGGKSEVALKEAVVERYPRDSFFCASKLPLFDEMDAAKMAEVFQTSLDRAGLEYYDFYLLHALNKDIAKRAEDIDAWKFIAEQKAAGKIRHIGFSFHDSADVLDDILTKHPEAEFVQLQINYADWESDNVQSRKCYEVARRHNKPIIIMEPVKGGSLAAMTPEAQKIFKDANPEVSVPSWAVRYAASLEGVKVVLSGMSNEAQLHDNVSYMKDFKPLTEEEHGVVKKVVDLLNSIPTIPCTGCKYCVDGCPQKINIPEIFRTMNNYTLYNNEEDAKRSYGHITKEGGKASACLQCGSCEAHCPQHIEIIETLKKAASTLE